MTTNKQYKKQLSIIFDNLPTKKVIELFDFAQFLNEQYLKEKKSALNKNSLLIQPKSLRKIWDSSEEDVYELKPGRYCNFTFPFCDSSWSETKSSPSFDYFRSLY